MIRAVGKKQKPVTGSVADLEITTEARYFARKCGLSPEEAQKLLDEANNKAGSHSVDHKKGPPPERSW
ncbi:hypothetical protein FJ977_23515 [Mesorhizobium sp. B2-1-3A]|jgi:hypothetical protein|nr:hypothetical protein FJ977_23515 [Mesorhizobium sp. B2-1-3A]